MFRFVLFLAACAATQSVALPRFAYQQAEAFAVCSGRMSAYLNTQRSARDPGAAETAVLLENFDLMLDAVLDAAMAEGVPEREPGRWKARGWTEIAYLMNDARYSFDPGIARNAGLAMDQRLQDCRDLVLPS